MKTKLSKVLFLFVLALFAVQLQVHSQPYSGDNVYKIKVQGEDLYLTLPDDSAITPGNSQRLSYQPLDNTTNRQTFLIQAISGETNKFYITSVIDGKGVVEIEDSSVASPFIACKGNAQGVAERLDWWNVTRGSGTQLFSENDSPDYDGISKRRLQNTLGGGDLTGTEAKLSGGGALALDYVVTAVLSTDEFNISSLFISNPVEDELVMEGLNQSIKKISIYNLLGKQVISGNLEDNSTSTRLDVSKLDSGMYILKLDGENNASFSRKILKE